MNASRAIRYVAIGLGIGIAAAAAVAGYFYLVSETIIQRHYPLFSMDVHYTEDAATLSRGKHILTIAGCSACHGTQLQGKRLKRVRGLDIWAPNLTRSIRTLSDDEFARAVRFGVHPDGTSLWLMPSADYMYMSQADLADMIAYIHSLPAAGKTTPPPRFKRAARLALLRGDLKPAAEDMSDADSPLELGPRYSGGRYLARVTCALCHGLDLAGSADGRVPNLTTLHRYSLKQFFGLLREGKSADGRSTPVHRSLAKKRFSAFKDYEVMALYNYLSARAAALPQ